MQFEGVIENSIDEKNDQPLISKQSATPRQLDTSDDTLFMTFSQDDVFYLSRFTGDDRIFWFAFGLGENSNAANNQNVAQWKKRAKSKTASKDVVFEKFPETGQIPLKMTNFRSKRVGPSADLEKFNIIEEKRTWIPNRKYTTIALTFDEEQKFPAFYMAFMAGTRITNQSKHSNNFPDPPSNWRTMLTYRYAAEFFKYV